MARYFDGATQGIKFARNALFEVPTTQVTVSAWVYRDGNQDQYDRIIDKAYNNANTDPYLTYALDFGLTNTVTFEVGVTGTNILFSGGNTAIADQTWTNIIGSYNTSLGSQNLRCYINNVKESTTVNDTRSLTYDTSANGPIDIGARSAGGNLMKGAIAEIGVWNIDLAADVRAALAKGYSPLFFPRGLCSYFRLNSNGASEVDLKTGLTSSTMTATAFPHPRIIYPQSSNE